MMADIRLLLNPLEESNIQKELDYKTENKTPPQWQSSVEPSTPSEGISSQLPSPFPKVYARDPSPPLHLRKKQKMQKDAAVFTRGKIRGECRYPPCEFRDDVLEAHHQQYEIFPIGNIADYPRHIPYNSEKKNFLGKTGRECFEVFHYNFRIPGDEKVHCMMWDYNIGLVRTTPLFKCTGYSKTTPAKMLNRNAGLREICHSITGGALVAQGYWMPFEAAKAVAATFCWNIRYALTPIFGRDFPLSCLPPQSESFGEMIIDPAIIARCTEEARAYCVLEERSSSRATSTESGSMTPYMPIYPRHIKHLRQKAAKLASTDSDYSTDASNDEAYSLSSATPNTTYRNNWTPANTPRSAVRFEPPLPSPKDMLAIFSSVKRIHGNAEASASASGSSSPGLSPKARCTIDADEEYDADPCDKSLAKEAHITNKAYPRLTEDDEKAASWLMGLKMERVGAGHEWRGQKRRASA